MVHGKASRDLSIIEVVAETGTRTGAHAHAGDEHHLVMRGRWRLTQGDHVIEAGPGDYVRWDGTVPHDAEVIGAEQGAILIVRLRPGGDRRDQGPHRPAGPELQPHLGRNEGRAGAILSADPKCPPRARRPRLPSP